MANALTCHACCSTSFDALVERGSCVMRCARCGAHGVATSFIALQDVEAVFSANTDPGAGMAPGDDQRVAHGELRAIHAAICTVAHKGQRVLLVPG